MDLRGYYFIPSDLWNGRAHVLQGMKTAEAIQNENVSLTVVAPRIRKDVRLEELFMELGVTCVFPVTFLSVFSITRAGWLRFLAFSVSGSFFLVRLKAKKEIDFVYIRSEHLFLLVFTAFILRIPYFYEVHREGRNVREKWMKERFARNAHGLVVISKGLQAIFQKFNRNVVVVHDSVDLHRFSIAETKEQARKLLGLPGGKKIATYVGSITLEKGLEQIHEAARALPEIVFCVVGDDGNNLFQNCPANVITVGKVSNKEVSKYLAASDVVLLPHQRSIHAQSPMKLFEYMASGRPIVTSDLPQIREVLGEHKGVLYFEAGNTDAFVEALQTYISRSKYYNIQAEKLASVADFYSWDERGLNIADFIMKFARVS